MRRHKNSSICNNWTTHIVHIIDRSENAAGVECTKKEDEEAEDPGRHNLTNEA